MSGREIFFIYENWRAESKAVIHRSNCAWCRNGQGIHEEKKEGRNGQWHGPFETYEEAHNFAVELNRPVRHCSHCASGPPFSLSELIQFKKVKKIR